MNKIDRAREIIRLKNELDRRRESVRFVEFELHKLTKYNEALSCGSSNDAEAVMFAEIEKAKNLLEGYDYGMSLREEERGL